MRSVDLCESMWCFYMIYTVTVTWRFLYHEDIHMNKHGLYRVRYIVCIFCQTVVHKSLEIQF